ncbi:Type I restriction modification DNA specificity domain-containing protein [Halomonas sp. NYA30]
MNNRVKLGELCHLVTKGTTPTSLGYDFSSKGIPFLRIQNLGNNTVTLNDVLYIDNKTHKALKRSNIKPGDLLITIAGTIGRVAIVPENFPECNCNQAVAILRFDHQKLLPNYLLYWLLTNDAFRQISGKKVTATISNLSLGQIKELEIPLLPLAEQERIAAILNKAEAICRKRKQSIQFFDELLRAVFLEMFGDPVTNPMGWDESVLQDVAHVRSGVTKGKKIDPSKAVTLPYMRVANVQDGYLLLGDIQEITVSPSDAEKCKLMAGDILLTEGGDPDKLGRGHVWNNEIKNCIHQNHIFSVRIKDQRLIRPEFLSAQIASQRGKRYFLRVGKQTTGIATINKTALIGFEPLVPPIELQDRYIEISKAVSYLKEKAHVGNADLFSSLSQKAFNGAR